MFTKNDLKTGHIVKTRNGEIWVVLRNNVCSKKDVLVRLTSGTTDMRNYILFMHITNDLKYADPDYNGYDIMEVRCPSVYPDLRKPDREFKQWGSPVVFERKEVEKLTVKQVCERLGYAIEIVKED